MSLRVHGHVTGAFAENTYVIIDEGAREAAVIDPGEGAAKIWRECEKEAHLKAILLTHAHLDHILGLKELKEATGVPIYLHREDLFLLEGLVEIATAWGFSAEPAPPPDHFWEDGDVFTLGETKLTVIHTPGHSPGSVSLRWDEGVFTGDALFAGSIGRTDFPRSSQEELLRSIRERLYTLPPELPIYPGHMGTSTIGREMQTNMFVRA